MGYPVIIEYRPGGKGKPAIQSMLADFKNNQISIVNSNISTMAEEDSPEVQPISFFGTSAVYLTTRDKVSWKEIKNHCTEKKTINYGSAGMLSPSAILIGLGEYGCKNPLQNIPYKGGANAVIDLLSGQLDLVGSSWPVVAEHVKAGKLKILATVGPVSSTVYTNLPKFNPAILDSAPDPAEQYFYAAKNADPQEIDHIVKSLKKIYATNEFKAFLKKYDLQRPDFKMPLDARYAVNWTKLNRAIKGN